MKELEEARQKVLQMLENDNWIQWVHEGTKPATTNALKTINKIANVSLSSHCSRCLNLNGCLFIKANKPDLQLHPGCHCQTINVSAPIAGITAIADCDIRKFTEYIFHPVGNNGKKALFEAWGYDIMDSEFLQTEFIKQAQEQYAKGKYDLGKLDENGQRITITITLLRSNEQEINFKSGWMVYPDGIIKLTTPYGGKI